MMRGQAPTAVQVRGTAIMENEGDRKWPFFKQEYLGGGFKYFLFSPLFGEDSHFD